jgi:hypothetical protein
VSALHSERRSRRNWLGSSVFLLDDWLRKRQHVYEYSDRSDCLFRIQRSEAEADLKLSDGACVRCGAPIIDLHLWNEHLPALDPCRKNLRWARLIGREIATSLKELAAHMADDPSYDEIVAVRAEMYFGVAEGNLRIVRLSTRYGFESVGPQKDGAVRHLGQNALGLMLALAANPAAARISALRHESAVVYMSRANLDRYHPRWGSSTHPSKRTKSALELRDLG